MLRLTISVGGDERDYSRYVDWKTLQISEHINIPSQLTFSLTAFDAGFAPPPQRAYVRIYSTRWGVSLYTGYISAEPEREYVALSPVDTDVDTWALLQGTPPGAASQDRSILGRPQILQYNMVCTSDEHILNIKAVPFIPAYINRTQGQILTDLANLLAGSGFFDATPLASGGFVGSGDLVPHFEYDPQHAWSELAKLFGDGARYRYKARDKQLWYVPYGDQPLGIEYDESKSPNTFHAKGLRTSVLAVPKVNDVTMIGDIEGGNNREDYFVGDGFTSNFPLRHKMFRGASVILLQDKWNGTEINSQQWSLQDPPLNSANPVEWDFTQGALNVVTPSGTPFDLGQSFVAARNGIELAGGINLQDGEITFNDYCHGVIGGVYEDVSYEEASLIGGFEVTSPSGVTPTASGAIGVQIQPVWRGQPIGNPVITRANHNYVLQKVIAAPKYVRYRRVYRTVEGEEFGGDQLFIHGNVTFYIQDIDIAAATGVFYEPEVTRSSINNVEMPSFAAFCLLNNRALNLTLTDTTIAQMPMGHLFALEGPSGLVMPTGLILPMLPPDSGGYIGPVQPWPGTGTNGLPLSGAILAAPLPLGATGQELVLGSGFELQTAQITPGNEVDTLAFYAQTIPAAGTRIRLQSWEAQAAVSRIQDPLSISGEAQIVSDDGIRSAVITDLNPLPRTSEDCDNAAVAFLKDRTRVFYNGSYRCTSLFFEGLTSDQQFYPTVGRFLHVHSPRRGIIRQRFLVTTLSIRVLDAVTELLDFEIGFGADLYLEKVLKNFVDISPPQVLSPSDKAKPPDPRAIQVATTSFLPDLDGVQADLGSLHAETVAIQVLDRWFGPIEIRRGDLNWGRGPTPDLIGYAVGPRLSLRRQTFDQVWYMRPNARGGLEGPTFTPGQNTVTPLNDMSVSGNYTGQAPATFDVEIDYIVGPDAFRWRKRGEDWNQGVYVTGAPQLLQEGVYVIFGATTGHGLADRWTFTFTAKTSRRSKVIRVRAPLRPSPPQFLFTLAATKLQWDLAGDVRSIYGFELRAGDNRTVLVQKPITNRADLLIDLLQTPFPTLDQYNADTWQLFAYFWNLMWDYSEPSVVNVPGIGAGVLRFTPILDERYGFIGVKDIQPRDANVLNGVTGLQLILAYVKETTAARLYGDFTSIDATSDPVTLSIQVTDEAGVGFLAVGDYAVVNDASQNGQRRNYEIFQVIDITGSSDNPTVTLSRAQLGSIKAAHPVGRLYKVSNSEPFSLSFQEPFLHLKQTVYWPSSVVVAMTLRLVTADGFGPSTTVNLNAASYPYPGDAHQNPPAPGMRTCLGSVWLTGKSGDVAVGDTADFRVRLAEPHSIRCIYAEFDTASPAAAGEVYGPFTNAGVVIEPQYIEPRREGQTEAQRRIFKFPLINIQPGEIESFTPVDMPRDRRTPYDGEWPFARVEAVDGGLDTAMVMDGQLDFEIKFVNSAGAGSNLKVYFQT